MLAHMTFPLSLLGGGVISAALAGVKLYLNTETEEQYIQTTGDFDPRVLHLMVARAKAYGYELMDEYDDDGDETVTHWLEQTVFADQEFMLNPKREAVA